MACRRWAERPTEAILKNNRSNPSNNRRNPFILLFHRLKDGSCREAPAARGFHAVCKACEPDAEGSKGLHAFYSIQRKCELCFGMGWDLSIRIWIDLRHRYIQTRKEKTPEELIAEVPVIEVDGPIAICEGGTRDRMLFTH
ncbi:hypothetical protein AAMO2058_000256000 [Amorphochlora amoebiformis]